MVAAGGRMLHEAGVFLDDYATFISWAGNSEGQPQVERVSPFAHLATDRVSFAYPGSTTTEALDEVTVSIDAGQVVALVGENGSGKTTFAKILAGLYRPTAGRLLVDGREAAPGSVAVLFQDFVQYAFTAADNIGLGDPDRLGDGAAIRSAASQVGAASVVEGLPAGYQTRLTRQFEDGVDLSVGQWQRMALARAFFRDAELIILDEPTAALDPRAEAELFDAVRALAQGPDGGADLAPVLNRPQRRSDRRARPGEGRRERIPLRAAGRRRRPLRRAVQPPGRRLPRPGARLLDPSSFI
jgi:ATP-binding cassette subfamily B protein